MSFYVPLTFQTWAITIIQILYGDPYVALDGIN